MEKIKPNSEFEKRCPYCHEGLQLDDLFWQGMHVCFKAYCTKCKTNFLSVLEIGHAINRPCFIDLGKQRIIDGKRDKDDFLRGDSLLKSLQEPQDHKVQISKEVFHHSDQVIILNCIDYLYGHCLLKLLNAQRHLEEHPEYGLIVIVQKFLRWLVPDGVAEVWTVDIPLRQGSSYYTDFNEFVLQESKRFSEIYISKAYSHPSKFDITKFTGIKKHSFDDSDYRITFIWREDRTWSHSYLTRALGKVGLKQLALQIENWKVRNLLSKIRSHLPTATFTVAGLGKNTKFPLWIKDERVNEFSKEVEVHLCHVYSESRLIIGVHGSNLLLPSAHAGMVIDLMPIDRWGNFAQDILYQEADNRYAAFRYRYFSLSSNTFLLAKVAFRMLTGYEHFCTLMASDK